ncbi:mitofusin complex protein UGO1 Ecym_4527 [Eremothecium cymbalariae DBVPG|uniref:Mitochondrial fusion and transport protein UGO1 n=1 Tax=Eremothecium cymbalariae (strain CBS 270.75 / DBVPG 7215 / KCTC 17166 / NRRL Y-17582) TaxID=931890 RepID=G8JU61_ERECY|nr:hypothetical protein Ecym_4527 [Eremothecium cymbalariae DBVPG\
MDDLNGSSQLRPYYDAGSFNAGYSAVFKPDYGVVDPNGFNIASKLNVVTQQGLKKYGKRIGGDRKMLSELTTGIKARFGGIGSEYGDGNVNEKVIKSLGSLEWADICNYRIWRSVFNRLLQEFLKKYFQHLIQLPFDTARLLLQVGKFDAAGMSSNKRAGHRIDGSSNDLDSGDEDIDYFPTVGVHNDNGRWGSRTEPSEIVASSSQQIAPSSLHTMEILNSIMDKEGTKGVWRANNTVFIYNFLSESLDAWFTGLLSPFLHVPDPYFIDIIHSPDIQKSVILTLAAGVFTGLVLLPLDLIKTRLTIGQIGNGQERSLRCLVRKWSWRDYFKSLPGEMVVLNMTNSLVGRAFKELTSILLYQKYNIDRFSSRIIYHTLDFISNCIQLFFKLPVEALLRRCQVKYLLDEDTPFHISPQDLIIKPRSYRNIFVTFRNYDTIAELWRGWRIGLMGVICGHGLRLIELQNVVTEEEEKF